MALPKLAYEAAADWSNCEDESGDIDVAIEALGQLITALSQQDAAFHPLIATAAGLVILYCEHGGDPNGETSSEFATMLHAANLI